MRVHRWVVGFAVLAVAAGVPVATATAATPAVPQLAAIRAAEHPRFDRLVFQFDGAVPSVRSVSWVPQVIGDASGLPVQVAGRAFLRVVLRPAAAHDEAGVPTLTGASLPRTYDFAVLRQVVAAGDFEGVLSFGVGVWQKTAVHVFTLTRPSRVVVDFAVPRPTGTVALAEVDRGRTVPMVVGQSARIRLRTCVPCGYAWRLTRAPAPGVLRVVSTSVVPLPHPPGIVGFPYATVVTVKAVGVGRTSLLLDEFAPGGTTPVARYLVHFRVIR